MNSLNLLISINVQSTHVEKIQKTLSKLLSQRRGCVCIKKDFGEENLGLVPEKTLRHGNTGSLNNDL